MPPLLSAANTDSMWPQPEEIKRVQSTGSNIRPKTFVFHAAEDLWKDTAGAIWIPDGAADLQLRLCLIAHTSAAGHRGHEAI